MIQFGPETLHDLGAALSREWLETNGIGGFASSTIIGLNTRRYHALLVAATRPPVGRMVLLPKLEETLVLDDKRYDLSANQYPGAIHPQGHDFQVRFRLDPFPIFTWTVEEYEIEKSVFMVQGENTTCVQYKAKCLEAKPRQEAKLKLRPLIAFRDYHSTTHENSALDATLEAQPGLITLYPYEGLPHLYLAHNAHATQQEGDWYRNFEYAVERERGLDAEEDLFCPLVLHFDLLRRREAAVIASTGPHDVRTAAALARAEVDRRKKLVAAAPVANDLVRTLVMAADQFIVPRGQHKTVIAGYPWFEDWGRDTMIALPGLTLVTGRFDVARDILQTFAGVVDQGMLPNRFTEHGEHPEYNTVDATLWFFEAVRAYLAATGEDAFVRTDLYDVLINIIEWHSRGTRYCIRLDSDGLLHSGAPGVQLTWMDAKIGNWVVTPRTGKPVEIQALWYNALCVMKELATKFGEADRAQLFDEMASTAHASFNRLFWNEPESCLFDVISAEGPDGAIRPNQIFAVSLHHTMLPQDRALKVVEVVERELWTPYGLRTLSPRDSHYVRRYEGDARARDTAYHQGTAWPWLIGPFITAYMKVHGGSAEARGRATEWLDLFQEQFSHGGLGQVAEIYDAEPPQLPRGCFAQAWSVAELLRAAVQDVFKVPKSRPATRARVPRAA